MATRKADHEGSVGKRADGTWCGTVQVAGKRKFVHGKTRPEVVGKLDLLRHQARTKGRFPSSGRMTVAESADRWIGQAASRLSPNSLDAYNVILTRFIFPDLGHMLLS